MSKADGCTSCTKNKYGQVLAIVAPHACDEPGWQQDGEPAVFCSCKCHQKWREAIESRTPQGLPEKQRLNVNHPNYSEERSWPALTS